jgi:hypothetical protein
MTAAERTIARLRRKRIRALMAEARLMAEAGRAGLPAPRGDRGEGLAVVRELTASPVRVRTRTNRFDSPADRIARKSEADAIRSRMAKLDNERARRFADFILKRAGM